MLHIIRYTAMTYTLSIPDEHQSGVVAILQSLQEMGLIARLEPTDDATHTTDEAEMLRRVAAGEADIRAGRVATTAEVRERIVTWKQQ